MVVQALKKVPGVNASWHGDFIRQYHNIDISIAVQTPSGLMVPVIKDSDSKGLTEIGSAVKELAGKVSFAQDLLGSNTRSTPAQHCVVPVFTESDSKRLTKIGVAVKELAGMVSVTFHWLPHADKRFGALAWHMFGSHMHACAWLAYCVTLPV